MIETIIILILIVIDQGTKIYMSSLLEQGNRTITVIKNFFYLTYVENRGSAFGFLEGKRFFLVGVTALVLVVLFYLVITKRFKAKLYNLGWILILSGGLGNLIDRAYRGYVVDFLYLSFIKFPVFNFADICVTVGAVLVIIYVVMIEGRNNKIKNITIDK